MKFKHLFGVSILSLAAFSPMRGQTISSFTAANWLMNVGSGSFTPGITNGALYLTQNGAGNSATGRL